ncbi:ATP-binding protein [Streptomyces virens]|uniref:ATP-binding protein n=1 Tax=Streptomyces virens TaxID=285572 RepID=A0ABP6PB59_9ACTN|nr:ATP-binding protein [Streptomyces calvus]MBA8977656.1 anti-sigma regulatory factor (Ser/Thr protein kinase) [Streptomyces calvus]MYS25500.1 ATP-binding protein [Streptomyces sp. SID7804]
MHQETAAVTAQPTSPFPHVSVLLSATPRSARLARLLADAHLRDWGYDSEAARQVVAELAVNAATHGRVPGRDFRLALYVIDGTLRIEVTDTRSERLPELQPPTADAESGRGLLLVDALADRWGVTEDRFPRKTVWAELRLTPTEPTS